MALYCVVIVLYCIVLFCFVLFCFVQLFCFVSCCVSYLLLNVLEEGLGDGEGLGGEGGEEFLVGEDVVAEEIRVRQNPSALKEFFDSMLDPFDVEHGGVGGEEGEDFAP